VELCQHNEKSLSIHKLSPDIHQEYGALNVRTSLAAFTDFDPKCLLIQSFLNLLLKSCVLIRKYLSEFRPPSVEINRITVQTL
jgi:hypothetical protein